MTQAAREKLDAIAQELEDLADSDRLSLSEFARLYTAALTICDGDRRQLEFFGPFMLTPSYFHEAMRLSREHAPAA
jgi:hypothetical protein